MEKNKLPRIATPLRIDALNKRGLTMEELGKSIGFTRGYIQKLKTGNNGVTLRSLYYISEGLDCFPSELLPLDWQKPGLEADLLKEALIETENLLKYSKKQINDFAEKAELIQDIYEFLAEHKKSGLELRLSNKEKDVIIKSLKVSNG